jgi:hypothetical protein
MRNLAILPIALLLLSCQDNMAADNTMAVDETNDTASTGDTRPKEPCPAIENMLATAEDCADLTALQSDVKPGPAALDAPAAMVRGKTYEVTLVIDRKKPAPSPPPPPPPPPPSPEPVEMNVMDTVENDTAVMGNMADEIEPAAGPPEDVDAPPTANEVVAELPGEDTSFQPQVGRYMTAELIGSGFNIKLISPAEPIQVIPQGGQGRWQWEVVPTMGGQRRLTVKTQAVGIVDGKPVALGNGGGKHEVAVTVSLRDRVWDALTGAPAWIKALTAILVALGGLIAAWLVIRNRLKNKA